MLQFTRNLILPLIAGSIVLFSCSSQKSVINASRNNVKGDWLLNTISYEGLAAGEKVKMTLLDEGSEECLKGSTWVLPNNGNGSYTITANGAGCLPGQKNIVWSYRVEGDQAILQFKKLIDGAKAKDVEDGYRFKIVSATETSLSLQSQVDYQGNPVYINYEFSRQ